LHEKHVKDRRRKELVKISSKTSVVYCDNLKKSSLLQFSGDDTSSNLMILKKAPFLGYLGFSSAMTRHTSLLAPSQRHGNICVLYYVVLLHVT
jgi:hypothetical protein